jgi:hypothetical protein
LVTISSGDKEVSEKEEEVSEKEEEEEEEETFPGFKKWLEK